ncbi:MAG: hypothetical protein SV966_17840 [Actinomycetota bacterium]|nr:hypothetical protein [Actinomycetota bacterium]
MAEPVGWQAMRSVLLLSRSMAAVVDQRLAARDLVVRRAHPTDRRATLVAITDEGRTLAGAATAALAAAEFGLAGLTPDQLAALGGIQSRGRILGR